MKCRMYVERKGEQHGRTESVTIVRYGHGTTCTACLASTAEFSTVADAITAWNRREGRRMKVNYKGFEIDVRREKCMAGYDLVYRDVFRNSDGWQFWGDFSDDEDTVRTHIESMKHQIDYYLDNPEEWEEEE